MSEIMPISLVCVNSACLVSLLAFAAGLAVAARAFLMSRSVPPASFLNYHVDTVSELTFEVTYDRVVQARLAHHFHLSGPALCAYVRDNLVLKRLPSAVPHPRLLHQPARARILRHHDPEAWLARCSPCAARGSRSCAWSAETPWSPPCRRRPPRGRPPPARRWRRSSRDPGTGHHAACPRAPGGHGPPTSRRSPPCRLSR